MINDDVFKHNNTVESMYDNVDRCSSSEQSIINIIIWQNFQQPCYFTHLLIHSLAIINKNEVAFPNPGILTDCLNKIAFSPISTRQ